MRAATAEQYGKFLPMFGKTFQLQEKSAGSADFTQFRVLIIEGSLPLARLLATGIADESITVAMTHDRASAMLELEQGRCDLLILDLDLAECDAGCGDGLVMLRELRAKRPDSAILVLGGRAGAFDLVNAFDNGADDYLAKPFSLLEMMARVRALRRRSQPSNRASEVKKSQVKLRPDQCSVERDGRVIGLTPREFTLLEYMMEHAGQTLSRAQLTQEVWNTPIEANTNIVDVYMKYLRDKLDAGSDVKLIRTIRGIGYIFHPQA